MAKKRAVDRWLFTVLVLLVGVGLVMVYSASAAVARQRAGEWNPFLVKQALAAGLGLVAMVGLMHVDYRQLRRPGVVYGALGTVLALLVLVLFAPEVNNAHRWFTLGPVSFQPSELAKLALVVFLADQIERKRDRVDQPELLVPARLATGATAGLVVLEPDLGTAVLLLAVGLGMVFLAGLAWRYLALGAALIVPVVALLVLTVPWRRERIFAFLDPDRDPLGSGYQTLNSLIAVGSGGPLGRGLGQSLQKNFFLPQPHSDFVYAILAEELGLVGALGVLVLFALLAWRGVRAGLRAPDAFGAFLAWGITVGLVLQALINVSVAVALLPTKGIPLPFISYGGSSLATTLAACGVLLNVSEHGP
jgi:cell division protein FtsW